MRSLQDRIAFNIIDIYKMYQHNKFLQKYKI